MSYLLWALALFSDLVVLFIGAWLWSEGMWGFLAILVLAWGLSGGLDAWKPAVVRNFFKNAKEIGL